MGDSQSSKFLQSAEEKINLEEQWDDFQNALSEIKSMTMTIHLEYLIQLVNDGSRKSIKEAQDKYHAAIKIYDNFIQTGNEIASAIDKKAANIQLNMKPESLAEAERIFKTNKLHWDFLTSEKKFKPSLKTMIDSFEKENAISPPDINVAMEEEKKSEITTVNRVHSVPSFFPSYSMWGTPFTQLLLNKISPTLLSLQNQFKRR